MKQLTVITLTLLICIIFSFSISASAPTFVDNFSDHNKSEAKSDNIIYEIDTTLDNNTIITLNKPGEGYIIWKLEDLAYIKLNVLVFDGHNEKIENSIKLSTSNDGINWQNLSYKSTITDASGWDSYLLTASTTTPQKFVKVTIINKGDIAWSVKLDYIELFNSTDKPAVSPPTGDNTFWYYILFCCTIFYIKKLKNNWRTTSEIVHKNLCSASDLNSRN